MEEQNPWTTLSGEKIYDNPWINLTEYQVINPAGNKGIYGKVHFKNVAVGILPLDDKDYTWLVGQYRYTLNAYSWEIPAGGCPEGSDIIETANRELLEETGLHAKKFTEIQTMHLSNSVSDEYAHIFIAQDLLQGTAQPEETEVLKIKYLPFSDVYQMVLQQEITDSISVAAILRTQLLKLENKI
jgi:8-oxo-dGTP pyrophosphatase MutT (NUDIX family)